MKDTRRIEGARHKTTVIAVAAGRQMRVLASGCSIAAVIKKARTGIPLKREPAILFVPRRDAIHVF